MPTGIAQPHAPQQRSWVVAVAALCTVLVALSGVALVLADGSSGATPTRADRWLERVVRIEAVGCGPTARVGSGTWIDSERVLAAAHVVAGAERLTARSGAGADESIMATETPMEMAVAALDTAKDIALLVPLHGRFESPDVANVPLPWGSAESGERLRFVGIGDAPTSPSAARVLRTVAVRMAGIHGGELGSRRGLEIAARVVEGDSGALLADDAGRAVGMVFASSRQHDARAWATDGFEIRRFVGSPAIGEGASRCW